uniref:CRISPR type III-B/RAMP module-associated protein Cmr5 n=1 Tax=Cyanothece sp. (strain PCC 7425 / ATCC 29141) TaxID=395961 RepID=B8HYU4_CYAP4
MAWKSYELDRIAQKLVLVARERDPKSLNQSHKMRMAVAYGLERFWGEHLRLKGKEEAKSKYWKATWDAFCDVMAKVDIKLPKDTVGAEDTKKIQDISTHLWKLPVEDQRVAIAVLTQLCDCIVWWTQRYKIGRLADESDS